MNSGNANCATGRAGLQACERVCRDAATLFGVPSAEIFPSSTGIIGVQLPAEKITAKLPELFAARSASATRRSGVCQRHHDHGHAAEDSISAQNSEPVANEVTVLGIAKGAGMIHPQLATMLVYSLHRCRRLCRGAAAHFSNEACDESLNCISIDGDTSTNDTALLLASGASGVTLETAGSAKEILLGIDRSVPVARRADCHRWRRRSARDSSVCRAGQEQGRGVAGGENDRSLGIWSKPHGRAPIRTGDEFSQPSEDAALPIDPARVQIFIGSQKVCRNGVAHAFNEKRAHRDLSQPVCDIRVQLGRGRNNVRFLTTDLTAEYVRINADYST